MPFTLSPQLSPDVLPTAGGERVGGYAGGIASAEAAPIAVVASALDVEDAPAEADATVEVAAVQEQVAPVDDNVD